MASQMGTKSAFSAFFGRNLSQMSKVFLICHPQAKIFLIAPKVLLCQVLVSLLGQWQKTNF